MRRQRSFNPLRRLAAIRLTIAAQLGVDCERNSYGININREQVVGAVGASTGAAMRRAGSTASLQPPASHSVCLVDRRLDGRGGQGTKRVGEAAEHLGSALLGPDYRRCEMFQRVELRRRQLSE